MVESWIYMDDDTVAVNENLRMLPAAIRVYEVSGPLFFGASVIITVDPEKKRLVLSGREVEKEKKAEARKERLAQFKAGDVVEGTVDSIKDYGAFVKLADGIDGLVHISQISTQRIKHPGAVLKEGQTVKVKILSIADGKISLSMKALIQQETEEEEHETFDYKETASATTGLGDLLKGLKL